LNAIADASVPEDERDLDTPPSYMMAARSPATASDASEDPRIEHASPGPAVLALVEAAGDQETPADLPLVIEALLFSAEEPPTVSALAHATNAPLDAVEQALEALQADDSGRGVRIQRNGATVRLVTAPQAAAFIERLLGLERPNRLSKAALETIAIIAYRQPVTRGAIEAVRGVSCDAPLNTLRSRELVQSVGQADTPGRPHLWATTPRFLEHFGLSGIGELPTLPNVPGRPAGQATMGLVDRGDAIADPGAAALPDADADPNDVSDVDDAAYGTTFDDSYADAGPAVASGD
jgi:segregation and condensation protein B